MINLSKYDKTDNILDFFCRIKGVNENYVQMKQAKLFMFVLITRILSLESRRSFLHLINFHHPSSNQNIVNKHLMINLSS